MYTKTTRLAAFLSGARGTLPLLPGVVPFGLIYGVAARGAGLPTLLSQAMSSIVFAGSAQFAVVQLVAAGAPAVALVLTAAILNLRHVLYSVSLAPLLRPVSARWKALVAYLLTDESYGVVIARLRAGLSEGLHLPYALGSGVTLWSTWQTSTLAGLLIGTKIPSAWSLDFTATLTFIALAVPLLTDRAGICCAAVTALASVLLLRAPLKLGLVAATVAGVLAGLAVEALAARRVQPEPRAARASQPAHRDGPERS
jgi:4-azaleucine resistance transporter AzlC